MSRGESAPERLWPMLEEVRGERGRVIFLTGAGISAESGIPTFRGPEGYWKIGSRNYFPEELATFRAFSSMPDEIWAWYLWRRSVCAGAEPNAAHRALVELEQRLGDRFLLITQNVDGLHRRAGQSEARLFEIHGRIERMRCAADCCPDVLPIPEGVQLHWERGRALGEPERALLVCPRCGGRSRPHVLWFDERYDEEHFRFESSLAALERAVLLVVVGTSGATTLPNHLVTQAVRSGIRVAVLNLDPSPFSAMAERSENGVFWQASACEGVPVISAALAGPVRDKP
ncbi:MAG: Sir2 family NAD-dependent protein deacetylase [Myxococcota bacterium]